MYMHMRSIASVLALGLGCAQASHMTWACNDAEAFGDVGCAITHPAGPSFPGVVGVLGYGAAGTAEATSGGATDPGEGTLACIVVKHGPNADFPIPPVIAIRPFVTCSDLDKFPASEWANGGVRGLVGPSSNFRNDTLTGQATGEAAVVGALGATARAVSELLFAVYEALLRCVGAADGAQAGSRQPAMNLV